MPGASSFLFLVAMPGAPSSFLSTARSKSIALSLLRSLMVLKLQTCWFQILCLDVGTVSFVAFPGHFASVAHWFTFSWDGVNLSRAASVDVRRRRSLIQVHSTSLHEELLVSTSFWLLVRHLLLVAMHLLLVADIVLPCFTLMSFPLSFPYSLLHHPLQSLHIISRRQSAPHDRSCKWVAFAPNDHESPTPSH